MNIYRNGSREAHAQLYGTVFTSMKPTIEDKRQELLSAIQ